MDLMPMLLVGGIFLVIGFLISTLFNAMRSPTENRTLGEEVPKPFPEGLTEVMRLWQKENTGEYVPELKGKRVPSPEKITVAQHTQLASILVQLYRWLEGARFPMPALEGTEKAVPPASQPPENESGRAAEKAPEHVLMLEESFASSLPKPAPNLNPFAPFLQRRPREALKVVDPKEESMVAQIDEILQAKIKGSDFKERGLRLIELPGKAMVILVDGHQFEGVEAVEDEQVRAVIKSAVADWETRMLGEEPPPP
jgi:hypothetical protein